MPTIMPVTDLRNYGEVLREVAPGKPVYLTRNGRGRYAVVAIEDWEQVEAAKRLLAELDRGRASTAKATVNIDEVRAHLAERVPHAQS